MDYITLTGIRAYGTHGVLEDEHHHAQPFVVDAVMYVDLSDASRSDDLVDTVSYAQISERIVSIIEGEHCDLIERLAQRIADSILLSWRVQKTIVTVHKPQAPLKEEFADVSVTIERHRDGFEEDDLREKTQPTAASLHCAQLQEKSRSLNSTNQTPDNITHQENSAVEPTFHRAVIALGGNIGDVAHTMRCAIVDLDSVPGNQVTGISALYQTKPWGLVDKNASDFYNSVIEISTRCTPEELLESIHSIERSYGRTREKHWDSRTLDLDLIDYDSQVYHTEELMLPHPRAWQRAFVLLPWLDIDPSAVLVGKHSGTVRQLADSAPDRDGVKSVSTTWILGGME